MQALGDYFTAICFGVCFGFRSPKHTQFTVFYEKSGETPEKQKPL